MSFPKLNKLVDSIKQRQTEVVAGNRAFKKLSKQQQRIAIAEDALKQLDARKYRASPGSWCTTVLPSAVRKEIDLMSEGLGSDSGIAAQTTNEAIKDLKATSDNVLQPLLQETGVACNVCALGSLFASAVRKADNCALDPFFYVSYGETEYSTSGDDVERVLLNYFSMDQQRLMELAFEHGCGSCRPNTDEEYLAVEMYKGESPTYTMRAILKNIINNKGVFVVRKNSY